MDVYQSEHIRLNRPHRSVEFFRSRRNGRGQDVVAKQEALRDLKTASGIFSPGDQRQTFAARLSRLEEERLQARGRRQGIGNPHRDPAQAIEFLARRAGGVGHDRLSATRERTRCGRSCINWQVRKEEAAAKYTDAHPAKQAIDEQLQASRAVAGEPGADADPYCQGAEPDLPGNPSRLAAGAGPAGRVPGQGGVLDKQLAAVRGQMKDFNQQELLIAGLERDIDVCQATYRKYAAGMEQARIDQAREMQRISNITVAQPATFEPEAVFPKKAMFLAIGALCGLAAAVAVACWAEARNHSLPRAGRRRAAPGSHRLGNDSTFCRSNTPRLSSSRGGHER